MKYKPIFFYSEDDKAYVAMYPELPGCMADGETIHEALVNLEEAAEGWLQVYSERGKGEPISIDDMKKESTNPSSEDVAGYILKKTGKISTYALQKYLYYCQAWSYGWSGEPLFDGEFQAWVDGPVNPEVYQLYKGRYMASDKDIPLTDHVFSEYEKRLMDLVLSVYEDFTGDELSTMSHIEEPWIKSRAGKEPDERGNASIEPKDLIEYFGMRAL